MSERKYKYGEPTVLVSGFRVPISKVQDFKDSAYAKLDSYLYSGKSVIGDVEYHEAKTEMPNREFKIKTTEVVSESKNLRNENKNNYKYINKAPFSDMINIIGQKLHKHKTEEIYYIRNPHKTGANIAVLHSEKDVKEFIRNILIK